MGWSYTTDLSDTFFQRARTICEDLDMPMRWFLSVAFAESGCRANRPNGAGSGAIGLIQFMPDVLRGLGWTQTPEAFGRLQAVDQLPYCRRYFAPHKGKLSTLAGVYLAVFMPADVDRFDQPRFVLVQKDGRRGWAYAMNASLDANGDHCITVDELGQAVQRNCIGRRWAELIARAQLGAPIWLTPSQEDLKTTYGIQCALARLGFDPGPRDGEQGPRTAMAVRLFQAAAGKLEVDGIPGPRTRAALARALAAKAVP